MSSGPLQKDDSIRQLLAQLARAMDATEYQVIDHWDADRYAIGIASRVEPRILVYVSTYGQPEGRYAFACEVPTDDDELSYQVVNRSDSVDFTTFVAAARQHLKCQVRPVSS